MEVADRSLAIGMLALQGPSWRSALEPLAATPAPFSLEYFEIAEDRLAGKLPQQVTENELMRRYDLPRSRLVKILNRIAQEGWIERLPDESPEGREAGTIMGQRLLMTADELHALNKQVRDVVEPYHMRERQESAPENARRVTVSYASYPEAATEADVSSRPSPAPEGWRR